MFQICCHYCHLRVTTAAANTAEERDRWLSAVLAATKEAEAAKVTSPVLSSFGSSDEVLPEGGVVSEPEAKPLASLQRSNTSVHVCWHRGASLALDDHVRAVTVSHSPLSRIDPTTKFAVSICCRTS
jgi:FERM, RhoGEF and pleckstrin domain protein 2